MWTWNRFGLPEDASRELWISLVKLADKEIPLKELKLERTLEDWNDSVLTVKAFALAVEKRVQEENPGKVVVD